MFSYQKNLMVLVVIILFTTSGYTTISRSSSTDDVSPFVTDSDTVEQESAIQDTDSELRNSTCNRQLDTADLILSNITKAQDRIAIYGLTISHRHVVRTADRSQTDRVWTGIPRKLEQLHQVFYDLKSEIRESDNPDIVDIFILLDANGKLQALAIMTFLSEIERRLQALANNEIPGSNLGLYAVVDVFVGAGTGTIPAAVAALGRSMDESTRILAQIQTKRTIHRVLRSFLSCCWSVCDTTEAVVSAYYANPQDGVDDDGQDYDELKYDMLDFAKHADDGLLRILGTDTKYDLKTGFEAIALKDNDSILEIVMNAIQTRDQDTKARLKRFNIGKVFGKAVEILALSPEMTGGEQISKVNNALGAISQLQFITKKPDGSEGGVLSDLRDSLSSRTQIQRDIILVDIVTNTFDGSVFVPSFGYTVKHLNNHKKIINIEFKFAIPRHMYKPRNREQEDGYISTIQHEIRELFTRGSSGTTTTAINLLIDFLDTCNSRVLDEIRCDVTDSILTAIDSDG
ncbi:MAG: hypothetical protein LBB34_01025 [Holosporales bacterium]|nr:hypothetical protein [Holosporales bacterium]